MIELKTEEEIGIMREGGLITSRILNTLKDKVAPGVTLLELEKQAVQMIEDSGCKASFKEVPGYEYATCININEGVVHGIPTERVIKKGDVVSIDMGVYHKGFHSDSALSTIAGEIDTDELRYTQKFLDVGKDALQKALDKCVRNNSINDVSRTVQETIEGAGFSVSRHLVGHGIGRNLHEDPEVPGYVSHNRDLILEKGLVIAVEVIYFMGNYPIETDEQDGWTINSKDGSISGLFEHTVAITDSSPIIITQHGTN